MKALREIVEDVVPLGVRDDEAVDQQERRPVPPTSLDGADADVPHGDVAGLALDAHRPAA